MSAIPGAKHLRGPGTPQHRGRPLREGPSTIRRGRRRDRCLMFILGSEGILKTKGIKHNQTMLASNKRCSQKINGTSPNAERPSSLPPDQTTRCSRGGVGGGITCTRAWQTGWNDQWMASGEEKVEMALDQRVTAITVYMLFYSMDIYEQAPSGILRIETGV